MPAAQITPEFKKAMKGQMERVFEQKRIYRMSQLRLMVSGHEKSERKVYDDMVTFFCDHNVSNNLWLWVDTYLGCKYEISVVPYDLPRAQGSVSATC